MCPFAVFSGSPRTRFLLLFRLWFYEFSRLDDAFSRLLAVLRAHGVVERHIVRELRKTFYDAFELEMGSRNRLAHGPSIPFNSETAILSFADDAMREAIQSTGREPSMSAQDAVLQAHKSLTPALIGRGQRMGTVLANVASSLRDELAPHVRTPGEPVQLRLFNSGARAS